MKSMNYWQQFANSGNIKDYLSYVGSVDRIQGIENTQGTLSVRSTNGGGGEFSNVSVQQHLISQMEQIEEQGVDPNAGLYKCNWNDIETYAYRRI